MKVFSDLERVASIITSIYNKRLTASEEDIIPSYESFSTYLQAILDNESVERSTDTMHDVFANPETIMYVLLSLFESIDGSPHSTGSIYKSLPEDVISILEDIDAVS